MNLTGVKKILFTQDEIEKRIEQLGQQITEDYRDKNPVIIGILKGTMYFVADLTRKIDTHINVDYISIGVYPGYNKKTGIVRINKDLDIDISGRHVLMIENIIKTGLTVGYLIQNLEARRPASVKICTLLTNTQKRLVNIPIEYSGFEVPDTFVVGYGLDYKQQFRNLPYIAEFDDTEYEDMDPTMPFNE